MSIQQGPFDVHQLAGSIAVVTGAGNGGIGWGLARHCAALGMDVALIDLYANLVQDAQVKLSTLHPGIRCAGIECDVAKPQSLEACVAAVRREFGDKPIGAVFANAGVLFGIGTPILRSSMDEWQTTMNVNVIGVVNTIKAFVPLLQQQNSPSVMCPTASIGGLMRGGLYSSASYQASKHAVVAISEALSMELAKKYPQIRVHVVCPCVVGTALIGTSATNKAVADGEMDKAKVSAATVNLSQDLMSLAMTPERHAQQVFDRIGRGEFYLLTDNVRPYVDHDFSHNGLGLVRERFEDLMALRLDNTKSTLTMPFQRELLRRLKSRL